MKRVIFYFDGFNFYNGLKDISSKHPHWKTYYWIDLVKFCQQFLGPNHQLIQVNYFTAPPSNLGKRSRQSAFLGANLILNPGNLNIIKGQYLDRDILCRKCGKTFAHPEEKRTDVSIAVQMISDCYENKCDLLVLITADSDQIPAIQLIKQKFKSKEIKVYFPPERSSTELFSVCKPIVFLGQNENKFKASIMSGEVSGEGKKYTRPPEWKP